MNDVTLIIIWIFTTLAITGSAALLGRHYGLEFPIGMMASLVVISALLAPKIVTFGPFTVTAGVITFSSTFLLTDILAEKWDKATASRAVWIGFYCLVTFVITLQMAIHWPAASFASDYAAKFNEVLGLTPRIVLASIAAYLVSQNHDVWAFHFWKEWTNDRHLWWRNTASTLVSQLLDTAIFVTIAFAGVFTTEQIIEIAFDAWVVKVIIAICDTPFVYLITWLIDRYDAWAARPQMA